MAVQTGACLRKLAEVQVIGKITDKDLLEAFNIEYGEKVRVRHIQLVNQKEAAEARRRLENGEAFERVAMEMSTDANSKRYGGEIRPFSRAERFWPAQFVDAAFALRKPGELSDTINDGQAFHIIRLEERIPPNKLAKFEEHKEYLREKLNGLMVQARAKILRAELAVQVGKSLKIEDPLLRRQYLERLERAEGSADAQQVRRDLEARRPADNDVRPAAPTTRSTSNGQPEVARPPATRP